MAVTILNKDRTKRIVQTLCNDATAIGQAFENDNFMVAVCGDGVLTPSPKHASKEPKTFQERRDLKLIKSQWKQDILKKYANESGSAKTIAKAHYQVNSKF